MNKQLWTAIEAFDLDSPMAEYGFSTRLASENYWTANFTEEAINEYKKFMYLAAVSDQMVSPSEIVDKVWHQHLVFSISYNEFCAVLGKRIEHVPSTRKKEELERFRRAKEHTRQLYEATFGKQPGIYWNYSDMYQPLRLEKFHLKIRTFLLFGILGFLVLLAPAYFLLIPIYRHIEGMAFVVGYIPLIAIVLLLLDYYSVSLLRNMVKGWDKACFAFNLSPMELVYLDHNNLSNVVHGCVNQLVEEKKISISSDFKMKGIAVANGKNILEYSIFSALKQLGETHYPALLKVLMGKPIFKNIPNAMYAFKKYFIKSKVFGRLFVLNFTVTAALLLLGIVRVFTGVANGKPVKLLLVILVVYLVVMVYYLFRTTTILTSKVLPKKYKDDIIAAAAYNGSWEWRYFVLGNSALAATFFPLVNYTEKNSGAAGASGCGSSCGSSCSSCGGCGGGD